MLVTILAAILLMAAYFLVLYGGVGRISGSFPPHRRRIWTRSRTKRAVPRGAHHRLDHRGDRGPAVSGRSRSCRVGRDPKRLWIFRFFGRYLIMLYCMELYDILFFDWFLFCHSNFFPHFYPELKGIVGPHMFGYNKRTHILHFLLYIPLCAVIAGICMIF